MNQLGLSYSQLLAQWWQYMDRVDPRIHTNMRYFCYLSFPSS